MTALDALLSADQGKLLAALKADYRALGARNQSELVTMLRRDPRAGGT